MYRTPFKCPSLTTILLYENEAYYCPLVVSCWPKLYMIKQIFFIITCIMNIQNFYSICIDFKENFFKDIKSYLNIIVKPLFLNLCVTFRLNNNISVASIEHSTFGKRGILANYFRGESTISSTRVQKSCINSFTPPSCLYQVVSSMQK